MHTAIQKFRVSKIFSPKNKQTNKYYNSKGFKMTNFNIDDDNGKCIYFIYLFFWFWSALKMFCGIHAIYYIQYTHANALNNFRED